ncbi:hypothetical protein FA10DRAFT_264972 [Acaromyces ingoldii]|uniref:RlpA-like protein double-psi beta-barrel domain-containing protein n=1 Tax=Acaromyces ingoldii TaxID=215250 RepID=A0A316YQH2_9BASI|nr:hypothetical protein FA10DRAFT_264972 [Acaromyces ingoldii]PWN91074.1 hypothetical protein FA10DRAFT_264972 [Acaromyces ingoldii]
MRASFQVVLLGLASVLLLSASAAPVTLESETSTEQLVARGSLQLTWYAGQSMANPACPGQKAVSSSDYVVALPMSRKKGMCGKWINIRKGGKSVNAKVVDYCESCGSNHFDLSKAAFKKLAPLSQGVVNGASWSVL